MPRDLVAQQDMVPAVRDPIVVVGWPAGRGMCPDDWVEKLSPVCLADFGNILLLLDSQVPEGPTPRACDAVQ